MGTEFQAAVNRLVQKTRDGPVVEWVQRLAVIAARAGLPLERIDWGGSPYQVASLPVPRGQRAVPVL